MDKDTEVSADFTKHGPQLPIAPLARRESSPVAKYEVAITTLANELRESDEPAAAKTIGLKAETMRRLAKKARMSLTVVNELIEIRIRAERRMGELLIELKQSGILTHGGDRRSNTHTEQLKICDLGIDRNEASRSQKIAKIPLDGFEEYLAATKEAEKELSTSGLLSSVRTSKANATDRPSKDNDSVNPESEEQLTGTDHLETPVDFDLQEVLDHLKLLRDLLYPLLAPEGGAAELQDVELRHARHLLDQSVEIIASVSAHRRAQN